MTGLEIARLLYEAGVPYDAFIWWATAALALR